MNKELGYIKVAVAVPEVIIANPMKNVKEIVELAKRAYIAYNSDVVVFPELSITGYTCGDLFNQRALIDGAEEALGDLIKKTASFNMVIAVGMPVRADNQLFNCGVVIKGGKILGVVPKTFIPNYNEFYELRHFRSSETRVSNRVTLCGQEVPFSENLLFEEAETGLVIGIDVCEDLWVNIPPSSYHTLYGANLILNLSASNETVTKADYRKDIVRIQSAKCITAYAYASAGQTESTTDVVFSGHSIIADNGSILKEIIFPQNGSSLICAEIDVSKIMSDRIKFNSYMSRKEVREYEKIAFTLYNNKAEGEEGCFDLKSFSNNKLKIDRYVDPNPFIPSNKAERDKRCSEIINIQATGLSQRLSKIGIHKAIVGISGGLDSTLALIVMVEAMKKLNAPLNNIIGVTMPGFGTTGRTYNNALTLMKELGITMKEISIKNSCIQHFKDIGHDMNIHDVTYENVQARERTQVLMDIANKENGIVVGTGDLSELALGWCTYNGDQMSMYGVNGSIPKTLVRYLVEWYSETTINEDVKRALLDICNTPVSPELLPPDANGNIQQVTENSIGSYVLHDFFLYNMLRNGYEPKKIYFLARIAFEGKFSNKVILSTLKMFYKRFFTQQFKRSCMPDGVKVGSIALSPRGDWRMPSDASYGLWLDELENLK